MPKLYDWDIAAMFKMDAEKIQQSRSTAKIIHNSWDIKASWNEIENIFREFLRKRMPKNYYVGNGHVIDTNKKVSPQFDILISDNTRIPTLFTTDDGTDYFPAEWTYVIGEVKSTYSHNEKPIEKFCESMRLIKDQMNRPLRKNTAYNWEIQDDTLLEDMLESSNMKYLNPIYSFMFFLDSSNFDTKYFSEAMKKYDNIYMPNQIFFLDKWVILYCNIDQWLSFETYPEFANSSQNFSWQMTWFEWWKSTLWGNILSFLYYNIIHHLNRIKVESVNFMPYFQEMFIGQKSKIIKIHASES